MRSNTFLKLIFFLTLVFLSGCAPSPAATSQAPLETAYPIAPQATPTSAEAGYPIVTPTLGYPPELRGPDFNIDEPVKAGDTKVTGTGPVGVPIILVNVSFAGELMASTTIGEDGKFEFTLNTPLEAGISIGIQLGDIEGTDFVQTQFIYNENYFERPMIGVLFDLVHITQ